MRAFLDACVLFPPLVRRLLLDAAAADLFQPLWSERVLEEWRIASSAKQGADADARTTAARAAMAARFPAACIPPAPDLEASITLPDPADAHVLATAVAGRADTLVTFNLRDFPTRTLAGHGIEPRHPDSLLWELYSTAPHTVGALVNAALPDFDIGQDRGRAALKRARLPRLGKAWQADHH